jgi:hypothetical protein
MSALAWRASLRRSGVPGSVLGVDVGVEFAGEGGDEGGVGGGVEADAQHRDLALAPLQQQPGAVGALQAEGRSALLGAIGASSRGRAPAARAKPRRRRRCNSRTRFDRRQFSLVSIDARLAAEADIRRLPLIRAQDTRQRP